MRVLLTLFITVLCFQTKAQTALPDSVIEVTLMQASQYLTGVGKPKDEARAMTMYQECAEKGNGKAMNAIGVMYKTGSGVQANGRTAEEWFYKAADAGYAQGWYNLGLHYKNMTGLSQDFERAYNCFEKAAGMGDDQSAYYQGYMLYKGFGCLQNYAKAAALFSNGAELGKSNSMYFLGLCYRNGYGVPPDTAKAKYWLDKAARKGYRMAMDELYSKDAENSNTSAKELALKLKSSFNPNTSGLNEYRKIEHNIPTNAIEGHYKGYIIRYDWSGKHAINSYNLTLDIEYTNGELKGTWVEADSISASLRAILSPAAIVFKSTEYGRKDHYSPYKTMPYSFENARLQWMRKNDSVYLSGNVQMFSIKRNEPEKPLYMTLTRVATNADKNVRINLTNEDGTELVLKDKLTAYPNPFTNIITVDFELKESCEVQTQLLTVEGNIVYSNRAGRLEAGYYTLPVKPGTLAAGTYILKLQYGKQAKTVKVIKL